METRHDLIARLVAAKLSDVAASKAGVGCYCTPHCGEGIKPAPMR